MQKIFIIAGEASGDLHGADLANKLKTQHPDIQLFGMGGKLMQQAGVNIFIDIKETAFVGLFDILKNLPKIFALFKKIKAAIYAERPDLIILIDYPAFNLRLAKIARKAGIKVLYYISPQIWAWHANRIKTIKRYVDHMAVILPFEVEIYKKAQIPVTFVGHPLLKIVKPSISIDEAKKSLGLPPNRTIIGLMPGSRKSEISYLLPIMLKAAELLQDRYPNIQFLLPLASSLDEKDLALHLTDTLLLPIHIIKEDHYDAMQTCDAIIAASGTATLEVTILGIPLVVIYKTSPIEASLGRRLMKIPYLGLCNVIANNKIVQEFLQEEAKPDAIAQEISKILDNGAYRSKIISDMSLVKQALDVPTGKSIEKVVEEILNV